MYYEFNVVDIPLVLFLSVLFICYFLIDTFWLLVCYTHITWVTIFMPYSLHDFTSSSLIWLDDVLVGFGWNLRCTFIYVNLWYFNVIIHMRSLYCLFVLRIPIG